MSWLSVFDAPVSGAVLDGAARVRTDVPLAGLTWFRLGGPARYLVSPPSAEMLSDAWRRAVEAELPVKVLGGGANVLIGDSGFDGLVIRLDAPVFQAIRYSDAGHVTAAGGVDLMRLSRECAQRGLAGLEFLGGIPGTVGGAVCMNAGGKFGQFSDLVRHVDLLTPAGRVRRAAAADLGFGYRTCALGGGIVLGVELELRPDSPAAVLNRLHEVWRFKKASQPLADQSAGCIFKNPPGASAGALIDAAGLKGTRRGGAQVSARHANFIVADAQARATDVIGLIEQVRQTVARRFGVELELEIDIW